MYIPQQRFFFSEKDIFITNAFFLHKFETEFENDLDLCDVKHVSLLLLRIARRGERERERGSYSNSTT